MNKKIWIIGICLLLATLFAMAWTDYEDKRIEQVGDNIDVWEKTESFNLVELEKEKAELEKELLELKEPTEDVNECVESCKIDCTERKRMDYEFEGEKINKRLEEINKKIGVTNALK